jgi:hypothetical protein
MTNAQKVVEFLLQHSRRYCDSLHQSVDSGRTAQSSESRYETARVYTRFQSDSREKRPPLPSSPHLH